MNNVFNVAAKIVACGVTDIASAGTAVPLCYIYGTGKVALTVDSAAVVGSDSANFTAAHNTYAEAGNLYLKTAAGYVYRVDSVDAAAETLVLGQLATATEAAGAYHLYLMHDCSVIVITSHSTAGIWIGDSSVDKATFKGIYVKVGTFIELPATGLADLWIDGDNDGDDASWVMFD